MFDVCPFASDIICRKAVQGFAYDHNHVDVVWKLFDHGSKGLAHKAFGSVSNHCVANFARDGDAESRETCGRAWCHQKNKVLRCDTSTTRLNAKKILSTTKPLLARKSPEKMSLGWTSFGLRSADTCRGRHEHGYFLYTVGVRRLRPFRRRFRRTFWPDVVELRLRKPCVRRRLLLCG